MTPWIEPNTDGVISISQLAQHTTPAEVSVGLSNAEITEVLSAVKNGDVFWSYFDFARAIIAAYELHMNPRKLVSGRHLSLTVV